MPDSSARPTAESATPAHAAPLMRERNRASAISGVSTTYMPAEGLEWLGRDEILSFEEITRLVAILARLGVDEVRLTGGEPLVRRDLPLLVGMLASVDGVRDLSLTTNGVLLDRFAQPLVD